jgi:hypothetical protein
MKCYKLQALVRTYQLNRTELSSWKCNIYLTLRWNILYHLYSTEVLKDFSIKNAEIFSQELINSISFSQLFKPEFLIPSKNSDGMDYNSFLSSNPLILSTLESFKNLSKNFGNMQYSYNNVIIILMARLMHKL